MELGSAQESMKTSLTDFSMIPESDVQFYLSCWAFIAVFPQLDRGEIRRHLSGFENL